jgi:ribosomal protein L7Ae-like RNA K-turn-binding protein
VIDLAGPLGLCIKAGACCFGYENALKMLKKSRSCLVLVSDDASERTQKTVADKCSHYGTEIIVADFKKALEKLKVESNVKIISVNDVNFKKLIDKRFKGET